MGYRGEPHHMWPGEFDACWEWQGRSCHLCGKDQSEKRYPTWCVDHDHACCPVSASRCGKCVRAILCNGCNSRRIPLLERRQPDHDYFTSNWQQERDDWRTRNPHLHPSLTCDVWVARGHLFVWIDKIRAWVDDGTLAGFRVTGYDGCSYLGSTRIYKYSLAALTEARAA